MNIRKDIARILKEEEVRLLSEVEQGEFSFKTRLTSKENSVDIFNFKTSNPDETVGFSDLIINWHIEFESREYGVRSISVYIDKINGTMLTIIPTEGTDIENEMSFEYDSTHSDWKVKTNTESINLNGGLVPQNIEIDYARKEIVVQF